MGESGVRPDNKRTQQRGFEKTKREIGES
jgi:hypothetical protein